MSTQSNPKHRAAKPALVTMHGFLASAAAALDLTEEQLDTLFITAGGLQL